MSIKGFKVFLIVIILVSISPLLATGNTQVISKALKDAIWNGDIARATFNIPTKIYHDKSKKTDLEYYFFELVIKAHQKKSVIIFIPGGPGTASMQAWNGGPLDFILDQADVIYTDPRSVEVNSMQIYPNDSLTSQNLAGDIVQIIRATQALGYQEYYLYGNSYGTVVATIAASQATKIGIPPKAVILDGVIGKAFDDNWERFFIKNWKKLKRKLKPEVIHEFETSEQPFGVSFSEWEKILDSVLKLGTFHLNPGELSEMKKHPGYDVQAMAEDGFGSDVQIMNLLVSPNQDDRDFAIAMLRTFKNASNDSEIFKRIAYRELFSCKTKFTLFKEKLVSEKLRKSCEFKRDDPYDSNRWQINAPIYYFSGALDSITPRKQASYHFYHQATKDKHFITVKGGGHGSVVDGGSLGDCADHIWTDIMQLNNPSKSLKACKLKAKRHVLPIDIQYQF